MGSITPLPIAEPERMKARKTMCVASPVMNEKTAHAKAPIMANDTLFILSANPAIGICKASASAATIPNKVRSPWNPRPNSSRISGARIANAVLSSSSTALRPNRISNGYVGPEPTMRLNLAFINYLLFLRRCVGYLIISDQTWDFNIPPESDLCQDPISETI